MSLSRTDHNGYFIKSFEWMNEWMSRQWKSWQDWDNKNAPPTPTKASNTWKNQEEIELVGSVGEHGQGRHRLPGITGCCYEGSLFQGLQHGLLQAPWRLWKSRNLLRQQSLHLAQTRESSMLGSVHWWARGSPYPGMSRILTCPRGLRRNLDTSSHFPHAPPPNITLIFRTFPIKTRLHCPSKSIPHPK